MCNRGDFSFWKVRETLKNSHDPDKGGDFENKNSKLKKYLRYLKLDKFELIFTHGIIIRRMMKISDCF